VALPPLFPPAQSGRNERGGASDYESCVAKRDADGAARRPYHKTSMTEFDLIAKLTKSLPVNDTVVTGAGDDCAVLDFGLPEKLFLFKTDAVVEGVHFTRETPPEKIGRKALGRCLSDIAAMAGTPAAALITIGLPRNFDPEFVAKIYDGLNALARTVRVAIVGGETTTNPGGIFISVALLGTVTRGKHILRGGARSGDAIFVTGELGGSLAGKHLDFEPRIVEARWLADHFPIHAMADLSDGLAGDLRHILTASRVGAELLKTAIPVSRAAKVQSKKGSSAKPPVIAALTDGEDFELLFTVASNDAVKLLDTWKQKFPKLKLTCIGKIVAGNGIALRDRNGVQKLDARGYNHFG
jgi:thiamine-monophosphate kinase